MVLRTNEDCSHCSSAWDPAFPIPSHDSLFTSSAQCCDLCGIPTPSLWLARFPSPSKPQGSLRYWILLRRHTSVYSSLTTDLLCQKNKTVSSDSQQGKYFALHHLRGVLLWGKEKVISVMCFCRLQVFGTMLVSPPDWLRTQFVIDFFKPLNI